MRVVVVVGGVISGVGKGIATASIGKILQQYGFTTTAVKIDPYINYDAGTMRPTEHGEVWVTDDGGEIDQDLGNYERFLGFEIPKKNNITTGQVYKEIIDRERRGEYLGQTVQFIPHVPNEIKRRIKEASVRSDGTEYDFVLVEIGGTIGDYENLPFLFAAKSLEIELGRHNVAYVLVTYLPVPSNIGEMKTKPTQQAIRLLTEQGIFPDFILCRAKVPVDDVRKKKIEVYANIDVENVIAAPDVSNIYTVPLNYEQEGFGKKLLHKFGVAAKKEPDWSEWRHLAGNVSNPERRLKVAMVGKYVEIGDFCLADSYISVNNALMHAGAQLSASVSINWIDSKNIEKNGPDVLAGYAGVIVPGGFGSSGIEGKIAAIKYCRENNVPLLGLCYGMQLMTVEYARNLCGMADANSTEIDPKTSHPIIDILPAQKALLAESRYGASMRLGAYGAILDESTRVYDLYKRTGRLETDKKRIEQLKANGEAYRLGVFGKNSILVLERHRHRYEVNPRFVEALEKKGLVFSGFHQREDGTKLMEYVELPKHRFFVGTQAHPEFKSRLGSPSPLFFGFIEACLKPEIKVSQ
jgi:CTP synthase